MKKGLYTGRSFTILSSEIASYARELRTVHGTIEVTPYHFKIYGQSNFDPDVCYWQMCMRDFNAQIVLNIYKKSGDENTVKILVKIENKYVVFSENSNINEIVKIKQCEQNNYNKKAVEKLDKTPK